jgi:hypothetical protein
MKANATPMAPKRGAATPAIFLCQALDRNISFLYFSLPKPLDPFLPYLLIAMGKICVSRTWHLPNGIRVEAAENKELKKPRVAGLFIYDLRCTILGFRVFVLARFMVYKIFF